MSSASCDTCRASIPESDFESGAAISVLGKNYCGVCKNRAVKDISLDDLIADASPAPGSVPRSPRAPEPARKVEARSAVPFEQQPTLVEPSKPAPARAPRAAGVPFEQLPTLVQPAKGAAPSASPVTRRKVVLRGSSSKGPFIILGALAVSAAILVFVLVKLSQGKQPPAPVGQPDPAADSAPKDPVLAKEENAQRVYNDAMLVSSRQDASFEEIFLALDKAKPACDGTKWQAKLEELRNRKLKEKEILEAQRQVGRVVEELRAAVAADREYRKYGELMTRFQAARELASKATAASREAVQQLQTEYATGYEKAAEPFFTPIQEAATQLASERRFDDALKFINTFPVHLRQSGAWKTLDRLRADIEDRKRGSK